MSSHSDTGAKQQGGRARAIIKGAVPPVLFELMRRSLSDTRLGSLPIVRSFRKKNPSSSTELHTIVGGMLKGRKLLVDASGHWQQEMLSGTYDSFFFDYLAKLSLGGKIIFDIGTHVGYDALAFAEAVGKDGKVYAFEPNAANLERLRQNVRANPDLAPRIQISPLAISDASGIEEFVFSPRVEKGSSSGSFLDRSHTTMEKDGYEKNAGFTRTSVETISLDRFIEREKIKPSLLKIDIEGAEYLALRGAANMLRSLKPTLFIEIHSIFNMLEIGDTLREAAYAITLLDEAKDGRCFIVAKPR